MNGVVSLSDYVNFGSGFGMGSSQSLAQLNKALNTGNYGYANGVSGQVNGAALQVESLENSLKVLTYSEKQIVFWKKIYKTPAYSTVEEYNQLTSYGSEGGGFVGEGILPDEEDSSYQRKASFVKFLGTTRSVTHPMTLVNSAHGDVISLENRNGILWLMKKLETGLFWGNSKLAANGTEGVQFDGLNNLIDPENVIDLRGNDLQDTDINRGAQMIIENYGVPTDLFLPFETLAKFSETFFPKERVIMLTANTYQAGLTVNKFQSIGGPIDFSSDLFLQKTALLPTKATGGQQCPTIPASITAAVSTGTGLNDAGDFNPSGVGTYTYYVTACSRHGESLPTSPATVAIDSTGLNKSVTLTIKNASSMAVAPEWFRVYRTEKDGTKAYCILEVPATQNDAGTTITCYDKNETMPNTYTSFMGQLTPDVIQFKQLAPMMKMNLATLSPSYRWMILIYGVPQLFAPKKWMKFKNIKATDTFGLIH
jgi:hypothetical protein